jgi:large subunit ribosomal protein L4
MIGRARVWDVNRVPAPCEPNGTTRNQMPTVEIKDLSGATVGSLELDDSVWGADLNEHLLWEAVKWQRAKARAGTHSSLRVSEVRGTGKKPYRQKGTGNARQGTTRGAHHVGGGRAFSPKPRDYEYALPKKVKKAALRVALSQRVRENKLIVLDAFTLEAGAKLTKRVATALAALGAGKALVIDAGNETLARGTRNLPGAKWLAPEGLNVYDVLKYDTLVITAPTARKVEESLRAAQEKSS